MPCLFCVMCKVSGRYVSIITLCLDRYGHFNDVILNWQQVYSIGGATHTYTILIIAHVPMLLSCLYISIEKSCRWHEWQYMPACFGQVQPKKWTISLFFSRILAVVCLPASLWFHSLSSQIRAVICGGLL